MPIALILTRLFGFGDIRNIGSGNIGATNVLRTGNKLLAFIVLFLDIIHVIPHWKSYRRKISFHWERIENMKVYRWLKVPLDKFLLSR